MSSRMKRPATPRRAIVTGGSRGIGRALALALARRGVQVVAVARSADGLGALVADAPGRITAEVLDVGDAARAVARLRAIDREAPVDLVIANAGVGAGDGATPWSWEAVGEAFHVNFCGAAATLTALTDAMAARGGGHLVAIGSISSFGALPEAEAYCTPKAGLRMLMECLRLDLAPRGVQVTMVNLGFVRTAMVARSRHAMPGLMEPDEAAAAILAGLAGAPAELDIPRGLALLARGVGALPRPLRAAIQRALARAR